MNIIYPNCMEDALIAVLVARPAAAAQAVFPHTLEELRGVIRERVHDVSCSRRRSLLRYESSLDQPPHSPVERIAAAFITVQLHELE